MMYAGRSVLLVALVAVSVAALPNHLKAVVVDSDPVPIHVVKEIVPVVREHATPSASASAAADSGSVGSASAGLGHSGPSVSVGAQPGSSGGHKPVYNGPGFFDSIFNIPISVLQSVNTYLNNRGPITKPAYRRRGHHPVVVQDNLSTPVEQSPHSGGVPEASSASASASSSAGAAADSSDGGVGTQHNHGPAVIQKRVNYDEIFNIPISALKSVNQLLNG